MDWIGLPASSPLHSLRYAPICLFACANCLICLAICGYSAKKMAICGYYCYLFMHGSSQKKIFMHGAKHFFFLGWFLSAFGPARVLSQRVNQCCVSLIWMVMQEEYTRIYPGSGKRRPYVQRGGGVLYFLAPKCLRRSYKL
jgi:hypothetical protein